MGCRRGLRPSDLEIRLVFGNNYDLYLEIRIEPHFEMRAVFLKYHAVQNGLETNT